MIEWKQMTMQEAENKMEVLREIFDVVRLLKVQLINVNR